MSCFGLVAAVVIADVAITLPREIKRLAEQYVQPTKRRSNEQHCNVSQPFLVHCLLCRLDQSSDATGYRR